MNLPIELVLPINKSIKENEYISKSIIEFYGLSLHDSTKSNSIKTKKLIQCLNFLKYDSNPAPKSSKNYPINSKLSIPSFSIVLLTNSNQKPVSSQDTINTNIWTYHYKIELNDEHGRTIARQTFYKLDLFNPIHNLERQIPLCCRSNWTPPALTPSNQSPQKYIVRLNINCKNYDLMLFFYRLLFDKYPNYSKKDFSLFILEQNSFKINSNLDLIENQIVEFQLGLKYDPNVNVNKILNSYLIYKINDRKTFENIIRLLDGFVEEVEKNFIYTVLDPDHNKIYLIDYSRHTDLSKYFSLEGLADNYLSLNEARSDWSNYSPNSSSSETNSFDSGNWSCSTLSSNNRNLPTSRKSRKRNYLLKKFDSDCDSDFDEHELNNLLRKASNNSFLSTRNKNLGSQRSLSVLNEPYDEKIKLKSVLSNNSSLNRKKSKSVTFMDSVGVECLRSKSTTPIDQQNTDQDWLEEIKSQDYYFYKNSLIDQRQNNLRYRQQMENRLAKKPNVGITAETRFRRSHTLDMIRSTKMPLNTNHNYSSRFNLPMAKF